jgi:hypothetical protein
MFDEQKLENICSWKKNLIFFWSKSAIYLSLDLHKGRPSYIQRSNPTQDPDPMNRNTGKYQFRYRNILLNLEAEHHKL